MVSEIVSLNKLKIILQSSYFYIILTLATILYSAYYLSIPKHSNINIESDCYEGMLTKMETEGDLLKLELKGKEKIVGNYFFKTEKEKKQFLKDYQLGDYVHLKGTFSIPKRNTVPNLFNYQKYLNHKKIYYVMQIEEMEKIKETNHFLYKIKNLVLKHIEEYRSKAYLKTFILGEKNLLNEEIVEVYQENGISHLFALSGMHISLLSAILSAILKKLHIGNKKSCFLVILFLFSYMLLSGCSPSICRAVILFSLLELNNILNMHIKTIFLFLFTFCIMVVMNPNCLLEISFQYSFIISFYLILMQKKISNIKSYWKSLLLISIFSFAISLPISIYYFYQINFFSILLNLVFVPLVSILVFPLSLLTFIFPVLDSIFLLITNIMEELAFFFHRFFLLKSIWMKPNILWIAFYYIIFTLFLYYRKKLLFFCLLILLCYQYFHLIIFPKTFFLMIDVGQGDSLLIHSQNRTMLIDTGGSITYQRERWQQRKIKSISKNTLVPLLKSLGIKKINYLVLSHGDFDHIGEATNLIHNIKVENVILNEGDFNKQEEKVIELLKKKNIPYTIAKKDSHYQVGKFELISLNSTWDSENDSSIVFLMKIKDYQFLLMGDSGAEVEEKIIQEYQLDQIDFLKVGHHGSKTSTSSKLLSRVKPQIALISVGQNNRYHHPSNETIEKLKEFQVSTFLTSLHGSIQLNFDKNVTFLLNPP